MNQHYVCLSLFCIHNDYYGEKVDSISTPEAEATREENTFYSLSAIAFRLLKTMIACQTL